MNECRYLRRTDNGDCLLNERWCGKGGKCPGSKEEADAWWRQANGLWPLYGDHEFQYPGRPAMGEEENAAAQQNDLFGDDQAASDDDAPDYLGYVYTRDHLSSLPAVDDLTGADLDYWVAVALDAQFIEIVGGHCFADYRAAERAEKGAPWAGGEQQMVGMFQPSEDWHRGGYVIERHKIGVAAVDGEWYADMAMLNRTDGCTSEYAYGPTPLMAAMRCFVRSKFGDQCPAIYPASELRHKPTAPYWRDDPVKYQAWREREFETWGPEYTARCIEFDHAMALLDDALREEDVHATAAGDSDR